MKNDPHEKMAVVEKFESPVKSQDEERYRQWNATHSKRVDVGGENAEGRMKYEVTLVEQQGCEQQSDCIRGNQSHAVVIAVRFKELRDALV